jgi:hypothetical protein
MCLVRHPSFVSLPPTHGRLHFIPPLIVSAQRCHETHHPILPTCRQPSHVRCRRNVCPSLTMFGGPFVPVKTSTSKKDGLHICTIGSEICSRTTAVMVCMSRWLRGLGQSNPTSRSASTDTRTVVAFGTRGAGGQKRTQHRQATTTVAEIVAPLNGMNPGASGLQNTIASGDPTKKQTTLAIASSQPRRAPASELTCRLMRAPSPNDPSSATAGQNAPPANPDAIRLFAAATG